MGSTRTSDALIRALAEEMRVITFEGISVIATGLRRNTYDADIWAEPFGSPQDGALHLEPFVFGRKEVTPVGMGSWDLIAPGELGEVIARDHVFRMAGLDRPLDIFREPNQLEIESFDEVFERARPLEDGTRVPDVIDLLATKQMMGRDKDLADITFLEAKAEDDYLWPDCPEREPPKPKECSLDFSRHGSPSALWTTGNLRSDCSASYSLKSWRGTVTPTRRRFCAADSPGQPRPEDRGGRAHA